VQPECYSEETVITVIVRHLGPGPHPSGSPQSVHGHSGSGDADAVSGLLLSQEFDGHYKTLDSAVQNSLAEYAGFGYVKLNAYLRGKYKPNEDVWESRGFKVTTRQLDQATGHRVSKDMVVYRGMKADYLKGLGVGDFYSDGAYTSTSLLKEIALRFVAKTPSLFPHDGRDDALIEIRVPKGARGGRVTSKEMDASLDRPEYEILLRRDSKFKIVSKRWVPSSDHPTGRILHVVMEMLK